MRTEDVALGIAGACFILLLIYAPMFPRADQTAGMPIMPQNLPAQVPTEYVLGCERACGCFVHAPAYMDPTAR